MSVRGKRKAIKAPIVILSSDSEDESDDPKRSRENETTVKTARKWCTSKKDTTQNNKKDSSSLSKNADNRCNSVEPSVSHCNGIISTAKQWQTAELLAEIENLQTRFARNIVTLFQEDNSIPFICRYRRDLIPENMTPEMLRNVKNSFNNILELKKKSDQILKTLQKGNILTDRLRSEILCAKSVEELEFLYAPYKPTNKGSLYERAAALGLEKPAEHVLMGICPPLKLSDFVNYLNPDLNTNEKVIDGIVNIISHIFSRNTDILEEINRLQKVERITLKCTKKTLKDQKEKADKTQKDNKSSKPKKTKDEDLEILKYENYFNFDNAVKYIKPHQTLAIYRGEKFKFLSVKIIIPETFKIALKSFIMKKYLFQGIKYELRTHIINKSFEECYSKKLQPYVSRRIRSDLFECAERASIDVFAKNLKQLLLMSPLKGEKILGVDPGFSAGCKLALISETSEVLETDVIYPHSSFGDPEEAAEKLHKMLIKHNCKIIALGNGTACRETEFWLTNLFNEGYLDRSQHQYSIVSEQGASIYSCSDIAKKEFPNMDVNVISAVSIARRLNDPLSEYVKIEPRHIGVGMYQHDINEKLLLNSLNEVVMECVSFVGVDINTASTTILQHIAGLTLSRAQSIIEHRLKNGPFKTRKDLLKVKGVGEKTFTQCAGFIRIEPKSVGGSVVNLLDCTWVHPESYDLAKNIIKKCNLQIKKIGCPEFIQVIKQFTSSTNLDNLESEFKIPKERVKTVLEALQRELFQDYRLDINKKPLFKQGIMKMSDLHKGCRLSGAVTNITHFGAFIDIGVEQDGLIHTSNMNGMILNIGDRVEVSVTSVDLMRKRIQLRLEEISI